MMKHIPIMLALALSISLTSYDGGTSITTEETTINESTAITMNSNDSNVSTEELNVKLEDNL